MNNEAVELIRRYPLSEAIPPEKLEAELAELERLEKASTPAWLAGYLRLTGPGFLLGAGLGAGSLTSAMLMGAHFGYRALWVIWLPLALGLFVLAAAARFTSGGFRVIPTQNSYHGYLIGSGLTALLGCAFVGLVFSFGQYSLASHALESLTGVLGFEVPRRLNWIVIVLLTSWMVLLYGRKDKPGIRRVETIMKAAILLMIVSFGASMIVVGVDWRAMLRGSFVPWMPRGVEGLTILLASATAAIGVMDWVLFHYTSLSRGWGRKHETLARFDMAVGYLVPTILINYLVIAVCAETLHRLQVRPETASELAATLAPILGGYWSQVLLYVGLLAVPMSTTVMMCIATAITIHEAFGWAPDTSSLRWKITALLPQIGVLGVWYPRPLWLVIIIGAFLTLTKNFVGWSFYLLLNDRRVLGEGRCKSFWWNAGVVLDLTLINCMGIVYVLSQLGFWPE
ncbi:MAG: NRAMP family divalent metal transporter [Gemmatimonadaceae bacterium]